MTWTKLGDEFGDECWTLTDAAFRLHVEGLCWSNRKMTNGQIAKDDMRRWAKHPVAAEELVSIGWWEDHGGQYQIIHHNGYQRTQQEVANQSNANRQNARKRWAAKQPPPDDPLSDPQCDSHSDPQCNVDRTGQDRNYATREQQKGGSARKNGKHVGCSCGRPSPVDATGRCHWCAVKESALRQQRDGEQQ